MALPPKVSQRFRRTSKPSLQQERFLRTPPLFARTVVRTPAPAEGLVVVRVRRRQIYHHHSCLAVAFEVCRILRAGGRYAVRAAKFRVVGRDQCLFIVLHPGLAGDRAKDLFRVDANARDGFAE